MKTYLFDLYSAFIKHDQIVTDSREVRPGCIFFALKGEKFDGNTFAGKAIENGASLAVIDDPKYPAGSNYFLVENVLRTLQELATYHRTQLKIPVIGITGTNGKTTTKELITRVLSKKLKTCSTTGNLNNHIGVPLSVLSIKTDDEIAVIEMGANHTGEIEALCSIAQPDYGIITNVGKAHLEGFGSYEGVINAKNELFQHLHKNNGHAFVNSSDERLMNLSSNIERTKYGERADADAIGTFTGKFPYISVRVKFGDYTENINTRLVGSYNFNNVMAAACIGAYFGVEPPQIKEAIEGYSPDNNRSQILDTLNNKLILDAYNANPTSMEAALRSFAAYPVQNKSLIVGDMLELGSASLPEHQRMLDIIDSLGFGDVFLVGKTFSLANRNPEIHSFTTVIDALRWFEVHAMVNKTILIKASRGIRLEKLLAVL